MTQSLCNFADYILFWGAHGLNGGLSPVPSLYTFSKFCQARLNRVEILFNLFELRTVLSEAVTPHEFHRFHPITIWCLQVCNGFHCPVTMTAGIMRLTPMSLALMCQKCQCNLDLFPFHEHERFESLQKIVSLQSVKTYNKLFLAQRPLRPHVNPCFREFTLDQQNRNRFRHGNSDRQGLIPPLTNLINPNRSLAVKQASDVTEQLSALSTYSQILNPF